LIAFANPFVQVVQDVRALIVPQTEAITVAGVYGTPLAYIVPLTVLLVLLIAAWLLFHREDPYLAELT
jgi:ABC-type polysaccharide/polyol phosphate export permease